MLFSVLRTIIICSGIVTGKIELDHISTVSFLPDGVTTLVFVQLDFFEVVDIKNIHKIIFQAGSKEELLPGFVPDFPYIASRVEMDDYLDRSAPWHWHGAVELSYTQKGCLRYHTPGGMALLPEGSAILVNANVLHMTTAEPGTVQLLHIFEPSLLGRMESRIGERYLTPLAAAGQVEMLPLLPSDPAHTAVLERIKEAFRLSPDEFGYEVRLRNTLAEIWLVLFELARPLLSAPARRRESSEKIKEMMIYIHEHYSEKITVSDLAGAAFLSERECFRAFRECLHTTPVEYMKSYRLQQACRLLLEIKAPVTEVGQLCGLGSSSYFGKTFRDAMGCTPSEYRRKWQDIDN